MMKIRLYRKNIQVTITYKEVKRPFNAEYTFYIFKFDYSYNMFTVAGMAVNPEQTRVHLFPYYSTIK